MLWEEMIEPQSKFWVHVYGNFCADDPIARRVDVISTEPTFSVIRLKREWQMQILSELQMNLTQKHPTWT